MSFFSLLVAASAQKGLEMFAVAWDHSPTSQVELKLSTSYLWLFCLDLFSFLFLHSCVCRCVWCVCVGAWGGQKRAFGSPGAGVTRGYISVLGTQIGASTAAESTLNPPAISPAPHLLPKKMSACMTWVESHWQCTMLYVGTSSPLRTLEDACSVLEMLHCSPP